LPTKRSVQPKPVSPQASLLALVYKYYPVTLAVVALTAIYLVATFATPVDKATLNKYHISSGNLTALLLTIALPYIIIWYVALLGWLSLRDYTQSIKRSRDGAAFHEISRGVLWLTLWLPVSAVVSAVTGYYYHKHPAATAHMVQITTYVNIVMLLPGFLLAYTGSRQLLKLVRQPETISWRAICTFIIFSVLYTFLTLHDSSRRLPVHGVSTATYYLRDWLIVTTIIIPRLLEWLFGFQAAYNIYVYRQKVGGEIYKQALNNLARGLAGTVGIVIILRCIQSLSSQLNNRSLGFLLLVIYLLLILMAISYGLIMRGARSLKRIESI
jgi:uncharacterized membrane protein